MVPAAIPGRLANRDSTNRDFLKKFSGRDPHRSPMLLQASEGVPRGPSRRRRMGHRANDSMGQLSIC
jgi:hypothetical protein